MGGEIIQGDCLKVLKTLPEKSVQCVITSPPYWMQRDYGFKDQVGMEPTIDEYLSKVVDVFREVRRVLRNDGTLWVNMGDAYASDGGRRAHAMNDKNYYRAPKAWGKGQPRPDRHTLFPGKRRGGGNAPARGRIKVKDLLGLPWMVAFALRDDGWYLRFDGIWWKKNCKPESAKDRPHRSHEYLFLFSKKEKYFFDGKPIMEPSKAKTLERFVRPIGADRDPAHTNRKILRKPRAWVDGNGRPREIPADDDGNLLRWKRSVWEVAAAKGTEDHFSTYPEQLIEPCVLSCTRRGDTVLDPFAGSGTTLLVALKLRREYIGIEGNQEYVRSMIDRLAKPAHVKLLDV